MSRGFIERVENHDPTSGHYIPHHPVYKESATTPIRIVYDCSCKQGDNPSLNDCLDTGPSMINNLVEILFRFRLHEIAFVSDIEKAFLNIQLDEKDRNYTKFLWLSDSSDPNSHFDVYRFKAVLFGSVSSPFILNAVVKSHLEQHSTPIAADLQNNIYVDNVISGTETEVDAISYYTEYVKLLQSAGFKLRSWNTNNANLKALAVQDNNDDSDSEVKTLGMRWQPETDKLMFPKKPQFIQSQVCTKRDIVKCAATFFDPLGIMSPVTIKAKIFIQDLWSKQVPWDEPLSDELVSEWNQICSDMDACRNLTIDRRYFTSNDHSKRRLHVFSDASMKAYGAVAYMTQGHDVSFVIAKTRVKPLKEITVPRLELLASVIATQLTQLILKALPIVFEEITLWSDSQIALYWILSDKKLPYLFKIA